MTDLETMPAAEDAGAEYEVAEESIAPQAVPETPEAEPTAPASSRTRIVALALALLLSFSLGIMSGFFMSVYILPQRFEAALAEIVARQAAEAATSANKGAASQEVRPAANIAPQYRLPISYGDLGPQLLAAGGIDLDKFVAVYQRAGQPLNNKQLAILQEGSDEPIVLSAENAYFLLNFFWAVGLVNRNPILTEGAMMQYGGEEQIARFASTGGWTIGRKQPAELYASREIISLTPEQQALLEEVATNVYRPCCNNPTDFPDCNHGMAMLGLLELMAATGADAESMYAAAKWANAFWFPQQSQNLARFFQASQNQNFDQIDAQQAVSAAFFSGAGYRSVHQWLANNGLLEQAPSGASCGV
ncbi:MAG: hypothetical protein GXP42_02845 [Chloroflexi bacterium]|nr:hypothetical protein [Chloroflexota bacterium]